MQPREVISAATTALMRGDMEQVLRQFALPVAIEKDGIHHVVGTRKEMAEAITALTRDFAARGITAARGRIAHDWIESRSAFVSVESEHLDADGNALDRSKISYMLQRGRTDEWRIIVMSIDLPCAYSPGACVLDARAA